MGYLLNDTTVNEILTNSGADLEIAAAELNKVLTALAAIMPCLPGLEPLKAEHHKIVKAAGKVGKASKRLSKIRERLPDDVLGNRQVIDRGNSPSHKKP